MPVVRLTCRRRKYHVTRAGRQAGDAYQPGTVGSHNLVKYVPRHIQPLRLPQPQGQAQHQHQDIHECADAKVSQNGTAGRGTQGRQGSFIGHIHFPQSHW